MGPGIVIPVVLVVVAVPLGLAWARQRFKRGVSADDETASSPAVRLTSTALRALPTPPWRVVYEIAADKLGGVEHVLIGPPGAFAVQTSIEPLPAPRTDPPDPQAIARAAILRGAVDDALRKCAMSSDRLVRVHWGISTSAQGASVDELPGVTAVDGRGIEAWAAGLDGSRLTAAQVDLAWQTVTTAIGRPDPLA